MKAVSVYVTEYGTISVPDELVQITQFIEYLEPSPWCDEDVTVIEALDIPDNRPYFDFITAEIEKLKESYENS